MQSKKQGAAAPLNPGSHPSSSTSRILRQYFDHTSTSSVTGLVTGSVTSSVTGLVTSSVTGLVTGSVTTRGRKVEIFVYETFFVRLNKSTAMNRIKI